MLQSILDALALRGGAGQAQFVSLQGEVEFRRGDGGDWQEARSRVQLQSGDTVRTADNGSAADHVPGRHALHGAPQHPVHRLAEQRRAGRRAGAVDRDEVRLGQPQHLAAARATSRRRAPWRGSRSRPRPSSPSTRGPARAASAPTGASMELASKGGLTREVGPLQQVVQTGGLLSEPKPMPAPPGAGRAGGRPARRPRPRPSGWCSPGSRCRAPPATRSRSPATTCSSTTSSTPRTAPGRGPPSGVRGEGTFQWRVAAFGADGLQGPWSEPRKFRVAAAVRSGRRRAARRADANPPALDLDDDQNLR